MNVSKVDGCCSMITISNNPKFHFFFKKKDFIELINERITNYNKKERYGYISRLDIKTVILISNESFFNRPFWMKKAYTYIGWGDNKAHVMHIDFPNGIKL